LVIGLGEDCHLTVVLNDLIAVQDFLHDFVVRSWVREEWIQSASNKEREKSMGFNGVQGGMANAVDNNQRTP
jgi:hypothetical protein